MRIDPIASLSAPSLIEDLGISHRQGEFRRTLINRQIIHRNLVITLVEHYRPDLSALGIIAYYGAELLLVLLPGPFRDESNPNFAFCGTIL